MGVTRPSRGAEQNQQERLRSRTGVAEQRVPQDTPCDAAKEQALHPKVTPPQTMSGPHEQNTGPMSVDCM